MDNTSTKCTVTNNISLLCNEVDGFLEDIDQSNINGSDGCNMSEKHSESDSSDSSNESCIDDDRDESFSDFEVLRGDSNENYEEHRLEKEIKEKKRILKLKRQELCDRLMSYKLMQFSVTPDVCNIYAVAAKYSTSKTEFKDPSPVDSQADSESSASTALPTKAQDSAIFNKQEIVYDLSEESLIAMAIQASLEDMAKSQSTPKPSSPSADGASSSRFSDEAKTESGNRSYPEAPNLLNNRIADSSRSSTEPFSAPNPLHGWITTPDTAETQTREAGDTKETDNPVLEDFMESERYVGDKGKRPLSGKYSYKKRSKASLADSGEQPSGSNLFKDKS